MKIAYIDEDKHDQGYFLRSAISTELFSEEMIEMIYPLPDMDKLIEAIDAKNIDGLVVDYQLGEKDSAISYTGLDVFTEMKRRRRNFPCVVITSFLQNALEEKKESWRLVGKETAFLGDEKDQKSSREFFDRLKNEIEIHKDKIDKAKKRHRSLYEKIIKNKYELTVDEFQEYKELDELLEGNIVGDKKIGSDLKIDDLSPFLGVLERAKEIVKKIEQEKGGE